MASSDGKTYTIGHEPGALDVMQGRTADRWATQLLPHLRPGMRLLDCGCGPGSITVGLAQATPASGGMLIAGMIDNTRMGSLIVDAGLASREHLGRIVAAWRRLGDHPDGYLLAAEGEAVAWKP